MTAYEGHDATCTPTVYTLGMTFVDEGGEHVHVTRNEGAVQARTITVQLLPAGAPRLADATPTRAPAAAIQRAFGWQSAREGLFRASSGCVVFAVREESTTPSRLLTKSTSYAEAGNGSRSPMQLALLK